MSDFLPVIVTYIDSDVPFQWGLELERVKIPMLIYTSCNFKDELDKINNPLISASVYFSKTFKNTSFEKFLLLESACMENNRNATHIYWLDREYMQSSLSFEFLYSNIISKWLQERKGEFQNFFQNGFRPDIFFGGEVGLLSRLTSLCDQLTTPFFSQIINHESLAISKESIEFDNEGANNNIAQVVTEPVIHIIGDSHSLYSFTPLKAIGCRSNIFVNTLEAAGDKQTYYPYQYTHHIGAHSMYSLIKNELVSEEHLHKWSVKPGNFILLVFGEIDIRCHVWKQVQEKGRQMEEVINTLVENYLSYVKSWEIKMSVKVGVAGVIPPYDPKNYGSEHKPIVGSIDQRIKASKYLNNKLEEQAKLYDIFYFDSYDLYASDRGDLPEELSDCFCHISHYHKQKGLDHFYTNLREYISEALQKKKLD